MAKYTKYLFYISISLSFFSFIIIKRGYQELYPFFSWKLFSSPSGNTSETTEYRLYGVKKKDTVRISNNYSDVYDENEKAGLINYYSSLIENGKEIKKNEQSLLKFAKITEPSYQSYIVVKEVYNSKDLFTKNFKIYKKKIAVLK